MSIPSSSSSSSLGLSVLGSHPILPTIDSDSLYLTSLAVYSKIKINLFTLNPILNPNFPSLHSDSNPSSLQLTSSNSKIKNYFISLNPELSNDSIKNPTSIVLESLIQNRLQPLIQHHFFNIDQNWKIVSHLYARHLSIWNRSCIVNNLRKVVEKRLTNLGIWNLGNHSKSTTTSKGKGKEKENEKEDQEWKEEKIPRSSDEIKERGKKEKNRNRATTADAFDTLKIQALAREPLEILSLTLADSNYFFDSETPKSLDFLLFSHLAPIIHTSLPNDSLPKFIISNYPNLTSHTNRIKELIYSSALGEERGERGSSWRRNLRSQEEDEFGNDLKNNSGMNSEVLKDLGREIYSSLPVSSSFLPSFFKKSSQGTDNDKDNEKSKKDSSKEEEKELKVMKRIKRGRQLWLMTSLIGLIGYAFLSGMISVEFGEDQGEIKEGEEGEEIIDDENDEGGWTRVGKEEEEEEQDEEDEDEEDEEDGEEMEDSFEEEEEFELGEDDE